MEPPSRRHVLQWLCGVGGAALMLLAIYAASRPGAKAATLVPWGLALAGMAIAVPGASRLPERASKRWLWICISLVLLSAVPRFIALDRYPVDMHADEGEVAFEGLDIRHNPQRSLFSYGWFELPTLEFWTQTIGFSVFGENLLGLRSGAALMGTLSIAGQALFCWCIFGPEVAVATLVPLCAYHWHLQLSRQGISFIESTLCATWTFGLFAWGRSRRSPRALFLSGACMGLGCLTYPGTRVVPLILGVFVLSEILLRPRDLRRIVGECLWILVGFAAGLAPGLPSIVNGWDHYNARARGIVLWSPNALRHMNGAPRLDSIIEIARHQAYLVFTIFLYGKDRSLQYGWTGGFIDPLLAGFALVGLGLCFARLRDPGYRLLGLWFVMCCILGGALTVNAPEMQRLASMATVPYALAGVALVAVVNTLSAHSGRRVRALAMGMALTLCLGSALWNLRAYFIEYPNQMPPSIPTRLAHYFTRLDPSVQVRMLMAPGLYWTHGTIHFLNRERDGKDMPDVASAVSEDPAPSAERPRLFVLQAGATDQLGELQAGFPQGQVISEPTVPEALLFLVPGRGV